MCEMWLRDSAQYEDHLRGKKHRLSKAKQAEAYSDQRLDPEPAPAAAADTDDAPVYQRHVFPEFSGRGPEPEEAVEVAVRNLAGNILVTVACSPHVSWLDFVAWWRDSPELPHHKLSLMPPSINNPHEPVASWFEFGLTASRSRRL